MSLGAWVQCPVVAVVAAVCGNEPAIEFRNSRTIRPPSIQHQNRGTFAVRNRSFFSPARIFIRCLFVGCCVLLWGSVPSQGAHVPAERLLPRRTLAYLHVPSVPDLVDAFQETNFGRMINDPQIKPFVSGLFDAANNALVQVREATGFSLDEIAQIPTGEITLAVLPTSGENSDAIGFVGMADCGDNIDAARKFRESLQKVLEQSGNQRREETIEGITVSIYQRRDGDRSPLVSLERDNTLVYCSNVEVARQLLQRWTDGAEDCLAQNRKFSSIMKRCRGTKDEQPHVEFFVDPIQIFTELAKDNPALKLGLAFVPSLGLDGLKGIGGSLVLATEDFDGIMQIHVQLGIPRPASWIWWPWNRATTNRPLGFPPTWPLTGRITGMCAIRSSPARSWSITCGGTGRLRRRSISALRVCWASISSTICYRPSPADSSPRAGSNGR